MYNAIANLRKTLLVFLQAVPENVDMEQLKKTMISFDKVDSVHLNQHKYLLQVQLSHIPIQYWALPQKPDALIFPRVYEF